MGAIVVETRRAFTPSEVDDMELWVIAELLKVGDAGDGPTAPVSEAEFFARAADLNAERVRRHAAGLPPPDAPGVSATPSVTPAMMEAVRKRGAERRARRAQEHQEG